MDKKIEKQVDLSKRDADIIVIASAVLHGRVVKECKEGKISVTQAYHLLKGLQRIEAALVSADL